MLKDYDVEFANFLNTIRKRTSYLISKYPNSVVILAIYNNKVKVFVQDSYSNYKLKNVFRIHSTKPLISYLVSCHIQDPQDYELSPDFKVKEGVAYYFIDSNEIEKMNI